MPPIRFAATRVRSMRAPSHCDRAKRGNADCGDRRTISCAARSSVASMTFARLPPICSKFASRSRPRPSARIPGQLINMLFGNTSLHDDVTLVDADVSGRSGDAAFGGPRHGVAGLASARAGAVRPARLTCSALKPQGLAPARSGALPPPWPKAVSTSSRTIMASPTSATAPMPSGWQRWQSAIRASRRLQHLHPEPHRHARRHPPRRCLARDNGVAAIMVAPMISGVASLPAIAATIRTWRSWPIRPWRASPALPRRC